MRKVGVTANEMMTLREQGLSNADIAHVLGIGKTTVFRYIGGQGCRMESLAAFKDKPKAPVVEEVETPEIKRAVDKIVVRRENVASADSNFWAEIDYVDCTVNLMDEMLLRFDELPELATFIVGMTERICARDRG